MENSLFEVGKLASKHLTILATLQILLLLVLFNLSAKEVIAIPGVGISMERLDTLSILLLLLYLALWKFMSCLFYQMKLVLNFSNISCKNSDLGAVYHYVYPSALNYLLFHHYMNSGKPLRINVLMALSLMITFIAFPFISTIYLSGSWVFEMFEHGIKVSNVLFLAISFFSVAIVSWILEHLRWFKSEMPKQEA